MSLETAIASLCQATRRAARKLARASLPQIDAALEEIASELDARREEIYTANRVDLEEGRKKGLSAAMLDRLAIKPETLDKIISGVRQVKGLSSPLGAVMREWTQRDGLRIRQLRVPIGVIGIIYESRPNVTIDAAVLCLKAGNGVVLRGGSEAFNSNRALAACLQAGLFRAGLPQEAIQILPTTDREAIGILCRQSDSIDLLIPRGGQGLIETVAAQARMPVIKHYNGICHVYVHAQADPDMAEKIVLNAKVQRPGVCNAVETLLVDRETAAEFVPRIVARLRAEGVEVRGDVETRAFGGEAVLPATEADWSTEYLDLILSVRVVGGIEEAVDHVERYGSHHSDTIVTRNETAARRFLAEVDSATVYWNASTRFTDGEQFGFGAEIGISTDKIHARGPMGLEELTSYKYVIEGTGQVRE
ncbi:MAG: glutamate-5-semialdehyde dehydrogenase [Verrucomicrobium sp.]|nr:glutamate-5-semialdehyde dehydrogenase [Verrucomicrobium sp.]